MDFKSFVNLYNELIERHNIVGWNMRTTYSKSFLGKCLYDTKTLEFSSFFIEHSTEQEAKDTILHEIAHVLAGGYARHGKLWKDICKKIGCNPKATAQNPNMFTAGLCIVTRIKGKNISKGYVFKTHKNGDLIFEGIQSRNYKTPVIVSQIVNNDKKLYRTTHQWLENNIINVDASF